MCGCVCGGGGGGGVLGGVFPCMCTCDLCSHDANFK